MGPSSGSVSGQTTRRVCRWIAFCPFSLVSLSAFSQNSLEPRQIADSQKIQTARETNDRIAQLALVESAKQGDYVIGAGDLLGIEVFDVPELSRDVRVSETGFVSIPRMPVRAQGGEL